MDQKVVLVTGAYGGIGQALCQEFHGAGYFVLGIDLPDLGETLHHCHRVVFSDLRRFCKNYNDRDQLLSQVRAHLNGQKINVLVNNAATQILAPVEEIDAQDWYDTLEVNLIAPFLLVQAFLPDLIQTQGTVINIASIHAKLTKPNFSVYATSKAAMVGLTRSLAVELGAKVRVNAIAPAAISTKMLLQGFRESPQALERLSRMHPLGRIGTPQEVAKAASFLASDQSSFMSGTVLELDGGIASRLHDPA